MREDLTELEGAILSEIHHGGRDTAFKVRRSFEQSPSLEWRGGAGSIYPAIKRLIVGGRIKAVPRKDGRNAMSLQLTRAGIEALDSWVRDPDRASGPGMDPFRLRWGIWRMMPQDERTKTLAAVAAKLREDIAADDISAGALTPIDRERRRIAVAQQRARLAWIESKE